MRIRLSGLIASLIVVCLLASSPALAQSGGGAFITAPETARFPQVETTLKVYDAQGRFIHGLAPEQVTVLEDDVARPLDALIAQRPGAQVVFAVNPAASFGIRNAQAISRYDLIKNALRAWADRRAGSSLDDYSLLITGGPAASHTPSSPQWLAALESDTTDPRRAQPNLDTLSRAITLAADPTPRPGMGRAIVFITAPPEGPPDPQAIENLIAQAGSIPIHVWLVSSSGATVAQSVQQLMRLAASTGGQFFVFTGTEDLPDPESYLEPLRYLYAVRYKSTVTASGMHNLRLRVEVGEASVESLPQQLEVSLQPPAPAIIAPPTQIIRRLPGSSTAATMSDTLSGPSESIIQVVFDFPDGRKREIVYSALVVDGAVAAENLAPPFDRFTWQLDGYTEDGLHRLQVQARDSLGLTGSSVEIPVQVTVQRPSSSPLARLQGSLPVIATAVAVLTGAMLFLFLIVGGRLRPRAQRVARPRRTRSDPVTQPVHIPNEPSVSRRGGWASRLQWPQRAAAPQAEATLNPLPDAEQQNTVPPISVPLEGLVIGSDPAQTSLTLDDPSVERLHAHLIRQGEGIYRLTDAGSVAGTWINYTPISKEGSQLEHGDLVHIGRIGFRFTLRKPGHTRRPVIITGPAEATDNLPEDPHDEEDPL